MSKAKFQLFRGLEKDLPVLLEGEPAFTTDTFKLFVGSKNGNKQIFGDGGNGNVTPNTQSWTSTDAQDTFTISSGSINDIKSLIVFVDGIVQSDVILVNSTTFKLPETIGAGLNVYAIWFESSTSTGTTANRPTSPQVGQEYFDTTLGKPIWCKSASPDVWVDAIGTTV